MGPLPFGSGRNGRPANSREGQLRASMGPLPFGSGRAEIGRARSIDVDRLQWGRSLSEAEGGDAARASTLLTLMLQWGRSLSEAEGRRCTRHDDERRHGASMGPLPFGSGRMPDRAEGSDGNMRLQWGRSLSEAEGCSAHCVQRLARAALQWGRSLSEAEGPAAPASIGASASELQWGRSLSEAEGSGQTARRSGKVRCFNGAAPFRKRKVADELSVSKQLLCFNGAAPFRKRKAPRVR